MIENKTVCAIICAAGKGQRAGFAKNKLLVDLNGSPVLRQTLQAFDQEYIDEIIIAYSPCDQREIERIVEGVPRVSLVKGGDTRTQTVYNALQAVQSDITLIHDGARPFVSKQVIENCIESVKQYGSGICSMPCVDTIAVKGSTGEIVRVPDRNLLVRIQTPQGFYTEEIKTAYQKALNEGKRYVVSYLDKDGEPKDATVQTRSATQYTDDSSVYNDFVRFPMLCEGSEENIKLTYPSDFAKFTSPARCGFGIDTHAFGKDQDYILLAGVKIPSHSGLIAHSDGDVLVHAVMDALLSAAGLKDIGHYFPDTDEQWKGASSMHMLSLVMDLLAKQGYAVKNLSVAIQAEKPRLAKYIDDMKNSLSRVLQLDPAFIGVAAGTNEGLGYVGEGKGITVNAYVLLKKTR